MSGIVESVPNVSEGRRDAVVAVLADALRGVPGVALLHVHPDPDHNRTVYTVAGEPAPLLRGLEELYARALDAVDLRRQDGVHPRIGAVDVCPLVPLPAFGSTMAECVELSRQLAETVAQRFELPVFLYRESATEPRREDLAAIRRGEFEGLADKLRRPEWRPDHGPARPHPSAGATVIGARGPLIAYNVVLDSEDVGLARAIARRVRESSGGLAGIKAMGVLLGSRRLVQVSMNVERPDETPVHVVVDAVREAAAERGVGVLETELVGLAPLDTALAAARQHLQLPRLGDDQILETRVVEAFGGRRTERR